MQSQDITNLKTIDDIKTYNLGVTLTNAERCEFDKYINIFIVKYTQRCDTTAKLSKNLSKKKILTNLIERFKLIDENNSKLLDTNVNIAINNFMLYMYELHRITVNEYIDETEFSQYLTKLKVMPVCDVLLKHQKHYYEYMDELRTIINMNSKLVVRDQDSKEILSPGCLMCYDKVNDLDLLPLAYTLMFASDVKTKKEDKQLKKEVQEMIYYIQTFRSFFNQAFCTDYANFVDRMNGIISD